MGRTGLPLIARVKRDSLGSVVLSRTTPKRRRSKSLPTVRTISRRRANRFQRLGATGLAAFLSLTLLTPLLSTRPEPDKLTIQRDAAELARLELQSRTDDFRSEAGSLPSGTEGKAEIDPVNSQVEHHAQVDATKIDDDPGQFNRSGTEYRSRRPEKEAAGIEKSFRRSTHNGGSPQHKNWLFPPENATTPKGTLPVASVDRFHSPNFVMAKDAASSSWTAYETACFGRFGSHRLFPESVRRLTARRPPG